MAPVYDVIIVGGGAAGLSAALVLGRCRRTVLICDDGMQRNFNRRRALVFDQPETLDWHGFDTLATWFQG